jgi:hypothetical protein
MKKARQPPSAHPPRLFVNADMPVRLSSVTCNLQQLKNLN